MAKLDELVENFSKTKDNKLFAEMMETLEKAMVMVPAQPPQEIAEELKEAAKTGKSVPVSKGTEPQICLLAKADGGKIFPVFTSKDQIPKDKMPPALLNLPFKAVVGMVKANDSMVKDIVVNPFSIGVVLNEKLVDVVAKRYEAQDKAAAAGSQTVQVTEKQFHSIAHSKVAREVLPARIFKDTENALSDLRIKKEKMILEAYKVVYPENLECPYSEDDIAIMSLMLDDDLLIHRIDLPEANMAVGCPQRVYIAEEGENNLYYYFIEKGGKDNPGHIAQMDSNGNYSVVMEAPDNGVEIETIMSLIRPS